MPGFILMWLFAALVVGVAFVGRHVDGSADELIGGDAPVVLVVTWLVVALLIAVAVTRRIQLIARVEAGSGLVMSYDALPWLLTPAWGITIGALLTQHWILLAIAAALCLEQLTLLVPRTRPMHRPVWADRAPTLDLVVANVFVHNKTPEVAARQLVDCGADVVIVNESTAAFLELFDAAGGLAAYPFRISDPSDMSEYAITLASRLPLGSGSGVRDVGPLRLAIAELDQDGSPVWVVATHLSATLELGGLAVWKEQLRELAHVIPSLPKPFVVAGDFNMTRYRPHFDRLLRLGLNDAFDALGAGMSRSIKVAASGPLSALGPVARLDHALIDRGLCALSAENLQACGSDHLPYRLRMAIRPRSGRPRVSSNN
jgi:endonuclease/exonuclease/phosphatase (EEP) superfamily protein YafD